MTAETARAEAAAADDERRRGRTDAPLLGIPVAVKDLCDMTGTASMAGMPLRRDHVATEDAAVVERLRRAGAVIIGKTSLTEGATANHHPDVAAPQNPWDRSRWTGVSSSGSGVATAAGLCFGSLGSDTGGSIRFPSAANSLVGIKPTYGRVPRHGVFPLAESLDHVGPMTRTVTDAAHLLGVLAGYDPRDPTSLRVAVPRYAAAVDSGIEGVRIGIDERFIAADMDPTVVGRVLAAADVLSEAGAVRAAVEMPDVGELTSAWAPFTGAEAMLAHARYYPERASEYGPGLAALLDEGTRMTAAEYARVSVGRAEFRGRLDAELFSDVDLLLMPSLGMPVPPADIPREIAEDPGAVGLIMRFTAPFDFSGHPTISVPCGFDEDGLPISLQLVGRATEEALLCRAGRAYECRTDWHRRHPDV